MQNSQNQKPAYKLAFRYNLIIVLNKKTQEKKEERNLRKTKKVQTLF